MTNNYLIPTLEKKIIYVFSVLFFLGMCASQEGSESTRDESNFFSARLDSSQIF